MSFFIVLFGVWLIYKYSTYDPKTPSVEIKKEDGSGSFIKTVDDKFIQNTKSIYVELRDIYSNSPKETIGEMYSSLCRGLLGGTVMFILAFIWWIFIMVSAFVLFILSGCGLYIGYEWLHSGGYL